MKKILGISLIIIMFFGFFYFWKQEKKEVVKSVKVWETKELIVHNLKSHKDKNSLIPNKKPTVRINGFTIIAVGDVMTLHSTVNDEDGNITSYLWEKEGKILGRKPELSLMLSKEGQHTITLRITDNLGAMAKSSIDIDVFAPYDKKIFYKHRHCHCQGLIYSYYNDDGNLTKEITQSDKDGTVIKEFTYDDKGKLLSMHYKNYYDESNLEKESTSRYDKFGNEIEEFGKKKKYGELDNDKLVSFYNRYKYNEKGKMIESSMENNGVLKQIEKHTYDKDGNQQSSVYKNYKEGILKSKSMRLYNYDENGNLLSETSQEYDVESEITIVSEREERRYNEAKQILEKRVDNNGDGEIDDYTYYVYDDVNHLLLEERDKSNNGSSERLTSYTYSTEGLILQEETKKEGRREFIKQYTYNSNGQETSKSIDNNGDGLIDHTFKTFYDNEGNRIREESYNNEVLSSSTIYNSGKIVERNRGGYNMKYIYDEKTGVLKHLVTKEPLGQISIKDYDDAGELVKEKDENGEVFYEEERRR